MKRLMIFATLTPTEYATVRRLATRDKLSIADFMRRAVNGLLLEEGLDDELLEEGLKRGRKKVGP